MTQFKQDKKTKKKLFISRHSPLGGAGLGSSKTVWQLGLSHSFWLMVLCQECCYVIHLTIIFHQQLPQMLIQKPQCFLKKFNLHLTKPQRSIIGSKGRQRRYYITCANIRTISVYSISYYLQGEFMKAYATHCEQSEVKRTMTFA